MSTGLPNSEWFRQLADGSTIVFFALRVQPELAFEFLGDAIETHIGCPAAEALADPRAALDQIDPAHADRFAEGLTLPPGEDSTMEFAWRHRDGRPVYTRIWYRSRRRDDGSVVLEGTVRDITQLHEAEVEL
ncbi:MAG: diguanylate cyclase, partial [Mycobacterium sp.]|nr:diguanylate cyclase [Mycobacterium sp.]